MFKTKTLEATAVLVGATIGAGILGIPYVVAKAGFWTGIMVIIGLGLATLAINLLMGEIVLRTKGTHQISGYAEKYIGKWGKRIASIFMIIGVYGALVAYTIGVGNAAATIFGGEIVKYSLIFFVVAALVASRGIKSLGKAELLITTFLIGVVLAIPVFSAEKIKALHFTGFEPLSIMVPFGVVLFAFMGSPAIPEMREVLGKDTKKMKKAIIIGTLIPLVVYLLFAVVVVGIIGTGFEELTENQRIATVALSFFVSKEIWVMANVFAIFAMSTSFIALSYALKGTFHFDYRMKAKLSLLLTFSVPLALFLLDAFVIDIANFINILGITGAITGGITGILIVMMHQKAKKKGNRKPEFQIRHAALLGLALAVVFAAGIINEIRAIFS